MRIGAIAFRVVGSMTHLKTHGGAPVLVRTDGLDRLGRDTVRAGDISNLDAGKSFSLERTTARAYGHVSKSTRGPIIKMMEWSAGTDEKAPRWVYTKAELECAEPSEIAALGEGTRVTYFTSLERRGKGFRVVARHVKVGVMLEADDRANGMELPGPPDVDQLGRGLHFHTGRLRVKRAVPKYVMEALER